jgi:Tol biopolymer transport system component
MAFTQNSNVFYLNLETHERTVVTTKGRDDGTGASYPWYGWSPDGKYLALLRLNEAAGAKVPQNLLILDRSGAVVVPCSWCWHRVPR